MTVFPVPIVNSCFGGDTHISRFAPIAEVSIAMRSVLTKKSPRRKNVYFILERIKRNSFNNRKTRIKSKKSLWEK